MISKDNLDTFLNLDENELKTKITAAAIASGADEKLIKNALSDMSKLKNTVSNLSQRDIDNLLKNVDMQNLQEIKDALNI